MKRTAMVAMVAVILGAFVAASVVLAAVSADRKAGKCRLQQAGPFDESKVVKIKFGKVLKGETSWRVGEFFDKTTVFAGVTIKNPTDKPVHFRYYVAFFDKEGKLIGCAGQGSFGDDGLAAGEESQLGSCLVELPKGAIKLITSYQLVFYESDKPVGKP